MTATDEESTLRHKIERRLAQLKQTQAERIAEANTAARLGKLDEHRAFLQSAYITHQTLIDELEALLKDDAL